jgi:outer membrane protein TolC
MKRNLLLFVLFLGSLSGVAQTQPSPRTLSLQEYLSWVDQYHPLLKAVGNRLPIAKAERLKARGAFDPTFVGDFASKEFKGEEYYRLPSWSLKSNTRGPVAVSLDWNQTAGLYTNPQDQLPEEGLFAVGGMVQLGNGLITDKRRTDLALAKAAVGLTEAQAELYRNELLLKASKAYWKWYSTHQSLGAYEKAIAAAREVYAFTMQSFTAGDASAMDTLDASALLSTWQADYYNARKDAIEALFEASNWLWDLDGNPVVLHSESIPTFDDPFELRTAKLDEDHPLVRYNSQKEKQLRIKRTLAREYLKPKVAVGGALIVAGNVNDLPETSELNTGDRLLKAKVEMPLLLREGRGYSRSTNLSLQSFQWERAARENAWNNDMTATANAILQLEQGVKVSIRNQRAMEDLLAAEKQKLEFGDSQLIRVNLRTSYFLKSVIQTAKMQADLGIKKAEMKELTASY